MPCYYPMTGYQTHDGQVHFHRNVKREYRTLQLPCGQCIGCRLEKSRQWAVRCVHEAQLHEENSFITLTYENMPEGCSLNYRDYQLFMKRLRKSGPGRVRFFMCGEYGEDFGRPHFHAILFGRGFKDRQHFKNSESGARLYTSQELEKIWGNGHCLVGEVTFQSAAYVARYVVKKITGEDALEHYGKREPEFAHMSLKPGIGAEWLDKYMSDVYPGGFIVINGCQIRPPKYYDRRLKKKDHDKWEMEVEKRDRLARANYLDNTEERLEVKEKVTRARIGSLKRKLR